MQNITLEVRKSKDRNLVSIKYKIKVAHSLEEGHSSKSKANPYILGVDMEIGRNSNRKQEQHKRKEEPEQKRQEGEKREKEKQEKEEQEEMHMREEGLKKKDEEEAILKHVEE